MGYHLRDHERPHSVASATEAGHLRVQMETGTSQERLHALRRLIELRAEDELTRSLGASDPAVAQYAITGLWECWFDEVGPVARRRLEEGAAAMNDGDLPRATTIFMQLMQEHPQWAEAPNKIATLLYLDGRVDESIVYCRRVVALKPDHFGAWNGMALCAIQIEDWPLALHAVRESLRLQPHSPVNLQLLKFVQSRVVQA